MSEAPNARLAEVMRSAIKHLHAFVKETEPTMAEWEQAIGFLTATGQICDDKRQEWILLSDVLGVEIFRRDVYVFDHIPSIVQPLWVATIVLGAFTCALLFAAVPAWRAARMDPTDALRHG